MAGVTDAHRTGFSLCQKYFWRTINSLLGGISYGPSNMTGVTNEHPWFYEENLTFLNKFYLSKTCLGYFNSKYWVAPSSHLKNQIKFHYAIYPLTTMIIFFAWDKYFWCSKIYSFYNKRIPGIIRIFLHNKNIPDTIEIFLLR